MVGYSTGLIYFKLTFELPFKWLQINSFIMIIWGRFERFPTWGQPYSLQLQTEVHTVITYLYLTNQGSS